MHREYFRHIAGFPSAAKIYLAGQFFYSVGQTAVWVLRNLYLKEANYSEDFIGQTLAVSSLGAVVVVLTMSRFMDRMRLRGFSILNVDPERARELKERDPAVRAGRYRVEVFPWILPAGLVAFSPGRLPRSMAEAAGE